MLLHPSILQYVSPQNKNVLLYNYNIIITLKKFNICCCLVVSWVRLFFALIHISSRFLPLWGVAGGGGVQSPIQDYEFSCPVSAFFNLEQIRS